MRTRPLTSARALGPVRVAEAFAPKPRRPFVLDARALARAGASRVLAIAPEAIGALHTLAAAPPAKAKADPRGVSEVRVFGPLSQRGSEFDCGFGDGYDAIEGRIAEAVSDPDTRALVVRIDSPGGDVAGLEQAVGRMRAVITRSGKPCAVYVDELAASAAYWIACSLSTAGIVVPESGGVGSIGCIAALVDETGALAKEGIAVELVRDPPGKAASHSYGPLTDIARARVAAEVGDAAARFTDAVAAARGIKATDVRALDGDVLRGSKAVAAGLADRVGSFGDAVALAMGSIAPAARAAASATTTTTTARTSRTPTKARARAAAAGETSMDPKALIDALNACSQACSAHAQKCDQTAEIAQSGSPEEIAAAAGECLQSAVECDKAIDACQMACAEASGQPMPADDDDQAAKALYAATGKRTLGEAIGALEAMKGQAAQLRQLAGEVATMKAARERETATKLLDDAQRGRKFGGGEAATAARAKAEGLFARFGLAALEAHVDALVPVAGSPAPAQEPKTEGRAADSAKPGAKVEKPYEKLTPGEKHALRSADPDTYEALRADWVSRGKPASAA